MKEKILKKNKIGLFLVLAVFFFIRTALLSPVHCFLMNSDYPYFRFSVEGVVYIILVTVFSVISAKLAFLFRDKIGETAALVYIIAMSDPLFFGTQGNTFKLMVDIVIQLLIINAISEKKVIAMGVAFPIVLFISTFLVPFSIIGYVPIMLSIYILAGRKLKKESKHIKVVLVGIACAIAGFTLNKILMSEAHSFSEWFLSFSFVDITETTKRFRLVAALLPITVFGALFLRQYQNTVNSVLKNRSARKENFEMVMDVFFMPVVISSVSMIFGGAECFCAINLVVPAIILTLLCLKDELCIKTMDSIVRYIEKNKIISLIVFVLVFALALKGAEDYYPARQLIFYIVY